MQGLIRGVLSGAGVGAVLVALRGVEELAPQLAGVLVIAIIPLVMSMQFHSDDPKYRNDYWYGFAWFAFSLAIFGVLIDLSEPMATLFAGAFSVGCFAFGIVHHQSSLIDLLHGGVAKGIKNIRHPQKVFLQRAMFGGLGLGMLFAVISGVMRQPPREN